MFCVAYVTMKIQNVL